MDGSHVFVRHRWREGVCRTCGIGVNHRRAILQCEIPKREIQNLASVDTYLEGLRCLEVCTDKYVTQRAVPVSPFGVTRFGQVRRGPTSLR